MSPTGAISVIDSIVKQYGNTAFGLITLFVVWIFIVAPTLDSRQLDFDRHQDLMEQQDKINDQLDTTARLLRDTSLILDRVSQRIDSNE